MDVTGVTETFGDELKKIEADAPIYASHRKIPFERDIESQIRNLRDRRARVLRALAGKPAFELVSEETHEEGRAKPGELVSDRPGRSSPRATTRHTHC